jgi:hypothetical protein
MMSRHFAKVGILLAFALPCVWQLSFSQSVTGQEPAKTEPKAKAEPKGRLPAFFSKIGVDDKQRESIYKIQKNYEAQIEKIEAELKAIKDKRDAEIHEVLTKEQKKSLEVLLEGAKAKAAEGKAKAAESKKEETKKEEAKK